MDQTRSSEKCYQNGLADERDSRSDQPNVTRNVQLALYSAVENSVGMQCLVAEQGLDFRMELQLDLIQ
jgi:hypothetical protein